VAEGGTQRADNNAPIAQECQWFLSNLVALSLPPLDDNISVSEGAPTLDHSRFLLTGQSSPVIRQAHNLKVKGSNLSPQSSKTLI
jgi:hypothetical protein